MNCFTTNRARGPNLEVTAYDKQLSNSDNCIPENRIMQLPFSATKNVIGTSSLLQAIKPLNYVSTAFGFTSLPPVETQLQGRRCGTFVRLRVCSCMWIAVHVASSCVALLNDIHYAKPGTPGKIITVNVLYTISLYLTSVASLCLCGVFRRHLVSDIIDKLEVILNSFMKTAGKQIVKRTRKTVVLLQILILGFSSFVNALYIYNECDLNLQNCLPPVLETLSSLCNSLLIAQFVTFVLILREQYKYINEILLKPAEEALKLPVTMFQTGRPRQLLSIENCLLPTRPPRNRLTQNQVFNCRLMMTKLISVSGLTGSYYGFPILLATFWIFTTIVMVLYLLFYDLSTRYFKDDLNRYFYILESVMWCVYCVMLITIMALSCHLTSEEVNITMFHVQNTLLHPNLDQNTIAELDKFSYQLSSTKNEITVSGFFVLNLQFLYGFFGVTFAYFVIMFQLN